MNLYQLCEEAGISVPDFVPNVEICGISTDSRKVKKGDLFLCICGLTVDGHEFAKNAAKNGAAAIIAETGRAVFGVEDIPVFSVENTRRAAARLYDAWYGHPTKGMKLIAVTGTNGKTSVAYTLRAILESNMYRCGLIGTVCCDSAGRHLEIRSDNPLANMTTPDPAELYRIFAEMEKDGVEYVVMEATSHALSLGKLDALSFDAAIFTNLTPEHLDFHGNMENYFFAKAQLFSRCKKAIINLDDAYGKRLSDTVSCPVITCSANGNRADFCAEDVTMRGIDGSSYRVMAKNLQFSVQTPIPGAFSVINSLEAAACAAVLGVSPSVITSAIGSLTGISGRLERVRLGTVADFSVFIDYAHTPDALRSLLETARGFCGKDRRIVLVFGCGGDRDKGKRPVMGRIASELADYCIITSDNSRMEEPMSIIREITDGMGKDARYAVIPSRAEAIDYAVRKARRGDVILLAGKGHEEYEITEDGKRPFCEKKLVKEAVLRYYAGYQNENSERKGSGL